MPRFQALGRPPELKPRGSLERHPFTQFAGNLLTAALVAAAGFGLFLWSVGNLVLRSHEAGAAVLPKSRISADRPCGNIIGGKCLCFADHR